MNDSEFSRSSDNVSTPYSSSSSPKEANRSHNSNKKGNSQSKNNQFHYSSPSVKSADVGLGSMDESDTVRETENLTNFGDVLKNIGTLQNMNSNTFQTLNNVNVNMNNFLQQINVEDPIFNTSSVSSQFHKKHHDHADNGTRNIVPTTSTSTSTNIITNLPQNSGTNLTNHIILPPMIPSFLDSGNGSKQMEMWLSSLNGVEDCPDPVMNGSQKKTNKKGTKKNKEFSEVSIPFTSADSVMANKNATNIPQDMINFPPRNIMNLATISSLSTTSNSNNIYSPSRFLTPQLSHSDSDSYTEMTNRSNKMHHFCLKCGSKRAELRFLCCNVYVHARCIYPWPLPGNRCINSSCKYFHVVESNLSSSENEDISKQKVRIQIVPIEEYSRVGVPVDIQEALPSLGQDQLDLNKIYKLMDEHDSTTEISCKDIYQNYIKSLLRIREIILKELRAGRWSDAEVSFVESIILAFNEGILPIEHNIRVGVFLCSLINCGSSRLSFKIRIGKKHYNYQSIPYDTIPFPKLANEDETMSKLDFNDIHTTDQLQNCIASSRRKFSKYEKLQRKISEQEEIFLSFLSKEEACIMSWCMQMEWRKQFLHFIQNQKSDYNIINIEQWLPLISEKKDKILSKEIQVKSQGEENEKKGFSSSSETKSRKDKELKKSVVVKSSIKSLETGDDRRFMVEKVQGQNKFEAEVGKNIEITDNTRERSREDLEKKMEKQKSTLQSLNNPDSHNNRDRSFIPPPHSSSIHEEVVGPVLGGLMSLQRQNTGEERMNNIYSNRMKQENKQSEIEKQRKNSFLSIDLNSTKNPKDESNLAKVDEFFLTSGNLGDGRLFSSSSSSGKDKISGRILVNDKFSYDQVTSKNEDIFTSENIYDNDINFLNTKSEYDSIPPAIPLSKAEFESLMTCAYDPDEYSFGNSSDMCILDSLEPFSSNENNNDFNYFEDTMIKKRNEEKEKSTPLFSEHADSYDLMTPNDAFSGEKKLKDSQNEDQPKKVHETLDNKELHNVTKPPVHSITNRPIISFKVKKVSTPRGINDDDIDELCRTEADVDKEKIIKELSSSKLLSEKNNTDEKDPLSPVLSNFADIALCQQITISQNNNNSKPTGQNLHKEPNLKRSHREIRQSRSSSGSFPDPIEEMFTLDDPWININEPSVHQKLQKSMDVTKKEIIDTDDRRNKEQQKRKVNNERNLVTTDLQNLTKDDKMNRTELHDEIKDQYNDNEEERSRTEDVEFPTSKKYKNIFIIRNDGSTLKEDSQSHMNEFERLLIDLLLIETVPFDAVDIWVPIMDENGNYSLHYGTGVSTQESILEWSRGSTEYVFPDNQGVPGRVFNAHSQEFWHDVSNVPAGIFHRQRLAKKLGVHSLFAVPIVNPSGFSYALLFYSLKTIELTKEIIRIIRSYVSSWEVSVVIQPPTSKSEPI